MVNRNLQAWLIRPSVFPESLLPENLIDYLPAWVSGILRPALLFRKRDGLAFNRVNACLGLWASNLVAVVVHFVLVCHPPACKNHLIGYMRQFIASVPYREIVPS